MHTIIVPRHNQSAFEHVLNLNPLNQIIASQSRYFESVSQALRNIVLVRSHAFFSLFAGLSSKALRLIYTLRFAPSMALVNFMRYDLVGAVFIRDAQRERHFFHLLGPVSRKPRKVFGPEKPSSKVRSWRTKKNLRFETLHKCKLCLNAKPVDIKSSVHQKLHGFWNGFSGPKSFRSQIAVLFLLCDFIGFRCCVFVLCDVVGSGPITCNTEVTQDGPRANRLLFHLLNSIFPSLQL